MLEEKYIRGVIEMFSFLAGSWIWSVVTPEQTTVHMIYSEMMKMITDNDRAPIAPFQYTQYVSVK